MSGYARGQVRRAFRQARKLKLAPKRRMVPRTGPSAALTRARAALARSGAPTFTRTKRRRNPMARKVIRQLGGVPSFSKFYATRPASKRVSAMKKVGAANYDIVNSSFALVADQGFQAGAQVGYQTLSDLKRILTHVTTAPLNPTQYVLESVTAEMLLTNSSLATAYVDIYDIVRKRDAGNDADSADPFTAWKVGTADQTSGALPDAYKMINSLPTDSRLLKDYFKVVQRSHIALQQGGTHKHSVKLKSNELIDSALTSNASGDLAGITMYSLIVVYGQPASIPQEGGPTLVTTSNIQIDVVSCQRAKYTWVQDFDNTMFQQDGLSTLAGEYVVSVGAGAIVPNQIK